MDASDFDELIARAGTVAGSPRAAGPAHLLRFETPEREAHTLIGGDGNIGAKALSALAFELETSSSERNRNKVDEIMRAIARKAPATLAALHWSMGTLRAVSENPLAAMVDNRCEEIGLGQEMHLKALASERCPLHFFEPLGTARSLRPHHLALSVRPPVLRRCVGHRLLIARCCLVRVEAADQAMPLVL
jgi:HPt (histidine-containing phosphotransfer) domain-containing protein